MSAEAICLFPYFAATFMVSRLWATVCLKHLMHCYDSTRFPPCPCLHKCSGMWATVWGPWVLSFMSESKKLHCCMRRESKTKATGYSQEVFLRWRVLGEGGLRPLILPAAHLPSGHLGFWEHCVQTAAFLPFKIWHKQQVKPLKSCCRCSSSTESLFLLVTSLNPVTEQTWN